MEANEQAPCGQAAAAFQVIICVDKSPNSVAALEYYAKHLHKPANKVIILHVCGHIHLPTYLYTGGAFSAGVAYVHDDAMQAAVNELKLANKEIENMFVAKCNALNMKHAFEIVTESVDGPGATIVGVAKKHHVGLIVVGSRGLGAIRRTILGSISDYVVHHSHLPTLVCPPAEKH